MNAIARFLVTVIVLGVALYVMLTTAEADLRAWATGAIGLVIGYWLK